MSVCQGHRLSTWLDDSQLQRIIGYNKNWLSLRCGRNFDPDAQWGNENQRIFCNGTSQTGFETSRKNETQAFSFELRHVFATDFFKKWVKLARTRNSKQYTIESKETALNYHQYFLALEGVEHLQRIKNDVGIQVCPICVCEVDKDDDVANFFCQKNSSESIETSADGMVHKLHGHCLDEGLKRGMKSFESLKCRQEGFYLQYYCYFYLYHFSVDSNKLYHSKSILIVSDWDEDPKGLRSQCRLLVKGASPQG